MSNYFKKSEVISTLSKFSYSCCNYNYTNCNLECCNYYLTISKTQFRNIGT